MSDICQHCGAAGVRLIDIGGVCRCVDRVSCLLRQHANANKRIAKLQAIVDEYPARIEEAFRSGVSDGQKGWCNENAENITADMLWNGSHAKLMLDREVNQRCDRCDRCGKVINTDHEGIIRQDGDGPAQLLCMQCQEQA